jgi:histidinol-phosphate phosphatase family protein
MRQAVILAGGKGTRLRERLNGLPKPLVKIGGVPLLEHQLLLAKRHGFDRILLLVNYAAERIVEYCVARGNWGIEVECIDDGEPLGTAGAVLSAFDRLDDAFLVIYGDTMLGVDLTRLCAFHRSLPEPAATLLLHPNDHPHDSDLVETDEGGRVTAFHPYPHLPGQVYPNLVNAALYLVCKSTLAPWRRACSPLDFGKDLFPDMLARGVPLFGYNSPEYIKDCGTPERLDRVCRDFAEGRIARASLDVPQSAVFLDRDGTINVRDGFVTRPEQLELIPGAGEAISRLNRSDYRTVVVTNQPVVARGDCTMEQLRHIHSTLENMLSASGAYVDRLYYCPHHPDAGFLGEIASLKIACECRKPNTGMIDRAVADLNIALDRSWMVGDSTADMLAARRAGLTSILVETGEGGCDGNYQSSPDFVAADLLAAVAFILDEYPSLSALCDEISARLSPGEPVFIGGLPHSGKTALANALRLTLQRRGLAAVVLAPDGVSECPGPIAGCDVVMIYEGALALQASAKFSVPCRRYFVETDEPLRRSRALREYRMRGCTAAEAEALYAAHQEVEKPAIMATAAIADRRITLPLAAGERGTQQSRWERVAL